MRHHRRTTAVHRIATVIRKDAEELVRHPAALVPAFLMVIGALVPAFLVTLATPSLSGEAFDAGDLVVAARRATNVEHALAGLDERALVQAFLFQQFLLLLPMVPVVGSMALAAHAVIGEKQARALEPLLATPLATWELLAAKTLMPFALSMVLLAVASLLYLGGVALTAAPGVWHALLNVRTLLVVAGVGPLVALAGLQCAVIMSSRVNDPRAAQQLGGLLLLPITVAFVAQLVGQSLLSLRVVTASMMVLTAVNLLLLWIGVRVFQRETILMRWK